MSVSIYKKVGIAAVIMMASVFLSRLFGLFRLMAIAYVGGRSGDVDAYQVAFVIPEILNHIAASGFLSITFIPIFSQYLSQNQEEQGWQVFSIILTCFGSLLLIFIVITHAFAPDLAALLARGRPNPVFRANVVPQQITGQPGNTVFDLIDQLTVGYLGLAFAPVAGAWVWAFALLLKSNLNKLVLTFFRKNLVFLR